MSSLRSYKKFGLLWCRRAARLTLFFLFIPAGLIWISSYYGLFFITITSTHRTPHKFESDKEPFGLRLWGCSLTWGMGHVVCTYNGVYTDYVSNKIPSLSHFWIDWSRINLSDPIDDLPSGNWHGFQLAMVRTGPMKDSEGNVEQWSKSANLAFPAWLLFSISLIAPIFYLFRGLRRIRGSSTRRGFAPILEERPGDTKSNATNVSGEHR